MKKLYPFLLILFMIGGGVINAQQWTITSCSGGPPSSMASFSYGPMYSSASANSTSRVAVIYPAAQLTALTGVTLTNMYFHRNTNNSMAGTPSFKIYLKEVSAAAWASVSLNWANETANATLVYNGNPATIVGNAPGWVNFPFTTNFPYSGNQNLAVFMEYINATASSSITWSYENTSPCVNSATLATKCNSNTVGMLLATIAPADYRRPYIGFDYIPPVCVTPPTAGTTYVSNTTPCLGQTISLNLSGNSFGSNQTYQWEKSFSVSGPWLPEGNAQSNPQITVTPAVGTTYYRCQVTCGNSTMISLQDTVIVPALFPGGTYTINSGQPTGGSNFASFTDAISAIGCGIAGSVTLNVVPGSGPYNEQIVLPPTLGSNASNTLRVNGNGAIVQYNSSTINQGVLMMNGVQYVTFDSLTFRTLNATNGSGAILYNGCDHDTLIRCTFDMTSITSQLATNFGICISSTPSSTSITSSGAINTYIGNCQIIGYSTGNNGVRYGIYAFGPNNNNVYEHNVISNTFLYGAYFYHGNNNVIHNNLITRETKTGINLITYGLVTDHLTGGSKVTNNRVEYLGGATNNNNTHCFPFRIINTAGTASDPVLIANNIVSNMTSLPHSAGIYIDGGSYVDVYHNTIVIDRLLSYILGIPLAGIYSSCSTANIKNNIVSFTGGSSDSKFGLYLHAPPASCDYNNIYINSPQSGFQNYGFSGMVHSTLAAFQASTIYEANGYSVNPMFNNASAGNLTPTNPLIDNKGAPVGITTDINGLIRNAATPDMGAIEFNVSGCIGTPVAGTASFSGNITNACLGGTVNLLLTGFATGVGINIQWEESVSGSGLWQQLPGATASSYIATIGGVTDYRALITCANGGGFDYSNTISINIDPFYHCYCSPKTNVSLHSTTIANGITTVNITNTTLNVSTAVAGIGGYTQHDPSITNNTASLEQGKTYVISSNTSAVEMWIDWDQNGLFDTAEYYLFSMSVPATASITVPAYAVFGPTGMRLRNYGTTSYSQLGACSNISSGRETEDFVITIIPGTQCNGTPLSPGAIFANDSSICDGSSVTLTAYNYPVDLGIDLQWESSPAGQNNFTPIAGATGFNYTTGALNADMDYRMAVTCTNVGGGTAYTNELTININDPQLLSFPGTTRCGVGPVTLNAVVVPGNSVSWYANATGGAPIGTGTSFTTPVIANTTTFYAAATSPASTLNTGIATPTTVAGGINVPGSGMTNQGILFDVYTPFILQTVTLYPVSPSNASGTVTIDVLNSGGVIVHTATVNVTGSSTGTVPQIATLNFNIQPGSYKIRAVSFTGIAGLTFNNTPGSAFNYGYPMSVSNIMSINASALDAANTPRNDLYYYLYDWKVLASCIGPRVPVVATVISAPAYTINASPDTICAGGFSTVSVSSTNSYFYTWTPSGSGSSFSAAPSTTTTYYVTGNDGNNCGIYDSVTVNVKTAPSNATVFASPDAVCMTGNTTVTISQPPLPGTHIEWEKNTGSGYTVIPGATSNSYTEPVTATTFYRAKYYCYSALLSTSGADTVIYNNPQVAQTLPGERCAPGPVTVAAMGANGTTINWYANGTGGIPLASNNTFTTPPLTATTTYYASAVTNSVGSSVGPNPSDLGYGSGTIADITARHMVFDVLAPTTLLSVDIFPTGAIGSYGAIAIQDASSTTLITVPYTTTVTGGTTAQTIPINITLQPGTGYKIGQSIAILLFSNNVGAIYSYLSPAINIVSNNLGLNGISSQYYYFYNWKYVYYCESPRVPVTATINAAASGTGLATGGTTANAIQVANSTQSYTDACNDTVAVVASGNTALGTTSAIVLTSATVPTHQNKPFVPRAYDINPATDGPATVTLYALQSEFNAYNSYVTSNSLSLPLLPTGPSDLSGMGNIVITQYHGSASAGTQGPLGLYSSANVDFIQNSSITVTPVGNYWKLTFPVTGFSGFFIHTGSNPLAIDLKNISAVNMGNRNRVDWTTGTEQSGDRFELERSADGTNFRKLAEIAAKGEPSGYSYWDETPVTGVNYYRLKMVDASGKGTYSKVVTATVKSGNFTVEAYPNPVKDVLTVKVFGVQGKDATVSITDITGKVIRTETMSSDKTTLEVSGLAQGMYLIKYADSDHSQIIKVNKQ